MLSISSAFAQQELVQNGSFEQHYSCPDQLGEAYKAIGWENFGGAAPPFISSPDLFDSCSLSQLAGVPYNYLGFQYASEGNAYGGLETYAVTIQFREFLGSKLLEKLKPGTSYHISFKTVKADKPGYDLATNRIGMRFSTVQYDSVNTAPINNISVVSSDTIITDTNTWTTLSTDWVADSAYQYVMIGNFFDDKHTDTLKPHPGSGFAYYYIDETSVKQNLSDGLFQVAPPPVELQCHDNYLSIRSPAAESEILIINSLGQVVYTQADLNNKDQIEINLQKFTRGTYIAIVKSPHQLISKEFIK